MIAVVIVVISAVALGQFALFYWRAVIAGVATELVSNRVRAAAGLSVSSVGSADFQAMLDLHELTPEFSDVKGRVWAVRAYYYLLEKLGRIVPVLAAWTDHEMILCSRYVAALVERRLECTLACAEELRSF